MKVGVLTGTGTYALEEGAAAPERVPTPYGEALVSRGAGPDGVEVLHISRHEEGHRRVSHQVAHRANIAALREMGASCVIAVTVCGAVDPTVPLGSLIVFDDLHFLANRLADGSLCTFHDTPGAAGRGHWIFESPFSSGLRRGGAARGGPGGGGGRRGGGPR